MKLVHPDYEYHIDFSEGSITALFFDDSVNLRVWFMELVNQYKGEKGKFVLSEKGEEISISENVMIVSDPLLFEISDKKITNKIQSMLKSYVLSSDMFIKTQTILSEIEKYAEEIKAEFGYPINFDKFDSIALLKMISFGIEYEFSSELEKLLEYMNLLHDICGIKAFVILNAFSVFSKQEIEQLCKDCSLQGHSLLLIEGSSSLSDEQLLFLKKVIIDSDGCELY